MRNNISVWLIMAQTNLHVGNESVNNFGVIDQTIQRDALTRIPCINSSSLKGAIKEYVAEMAKDLVACKHVFGSEKGAVSDTDTQKGSAVFFDANLLFLPIQNTDEENCLYKMAYEKAVLEEFAEKLKKMGVAGYTAQSIREAAEHLLNVPFIDTSEMQPQTTLKELSDDEHLPIIARNKLDNGESVNLWYEQVLPSKSILGTLIMTKEDSLEIFLDEKLIQIGANATVGYGYCTFVKLNLNVSV